MFTKTKIALAAALVLSSGVAALAANDRDGEDAGFVTPGSMDGVNPAYHPDWFPAAQRGKGTQLIDAVTSRGKAGEAFGSATPRIKILPPAAVAPAKDYNGYYQSGKD